MPTLKLTRELWIREKASKRLRQLVPILRKLHWVHQKYIDAEFGKDCPYWYNERPQVGLLAAAVWLTGGIALEEYGTEKTKHRKRSTGRSDLFIKSRRIEFECETKHVRLRLHRKSESMRKAAEKCLNLAVKDIRNLKWKQGLALCFVTTWINEPDFADFHDLRRSWLDTMKSSDTCDAFLWIGFRNLPKNIKERYAHPGMLLLVKEVRRSKRHTRGGA